MTKILCIGSVTTDVIITPADSIPPPGTLRAVKSVSLHVGGCAANAALDLAKLGIPVSLCCKVGDDLYGRFVYDTMAEAGVHSQGICRDPKTDTTTSVVCVNSQGERSFLYQPGSTAEFRLEDIPVSLLEKCGIVFVAGAMLLSSFDGEPCARFLQDARSRGKITAMDTAWDFDDVWLPKIKAALPYLDWFMPSVDEAAKLTGTSDPYDIADRLLAMGPRNVIVKLGKDGALLCPENGSKTVLPTYRSIKPVDTTGAGDAFCAGFLAGMAQGWDYTRCGRLANAVGTHCITAVGASTGIKPLRDILNFMDTHNCG